MKSNYFTLMDYLAVGGTLLLSLAIGVYHARGKQTNEDMLVGGRNMNPIPIAYVLIITYRASMLVTYLSAITLLGYPAEVYSFGMQVFLMTVLGFIFIPLSTVIFVKPFYKMKLTSVYEYLEWRFESVLVRWVASFTFILQIILLTGVALYAPSLALEAIIGLPVWISITGIGIIGTVYTSLGGIKAVIWTDCFQFIMILVGMFSITIKGVYTAGGLEQTFTVAAEKGRLLLFDFTFDPFQRHNFWNFLLGYGFAMTSLYGTHQPQVQRYCSLPSLDNAIKSLLLTIPLKLITMGLVVMTGISIFATYSGCCPILLGKITKADQIVPYFVVNELSFLPGLLGIFVSCIFSGVLSTISSTLNSLAAVTWEDFVSKIGRFRNLPPEGQAFCIRILAVMYGIVSVILAFGAQHMGQIFQVTMTAIGATAGALGGIFICALFVPCINKWGAVCGMTASLVSMMYIAIQAFLLQTQKKIINRPLPTSLDNCPNGTDFSDARDYSTVYNMPPELEWPEKLFTLSYILYPFVGAVICFAVAILCSIFTGGCFTARQIPRKYLHPWIQHFSDNKDDEHDHKSPSINNNKYAYRYDKVGKTNGTTVLTLLDGKVKA